MGDSRKSPYPTTGGISILTPLAFGDSKMLYPPCPLNSKIINPPPLQISVFFFNHLESCFDSL